jgi:gamma-glutamyltranspeptidase/glutathione hydrolase
MNVLEFGMGIREAVDAPRTDHEWFPERVRFVGARDPKFEALVERLRALGHDLQPSRGQGDANSILVDDQGVLHGAADNRHGAASVPG